MPSKHTHVLAFGTFDLLHPGHIWFLRQAAKLGKLTAVVARDINVLKLKGVKPVQKESVRLKAVQDLDFVNQVLLGQRKFDHRYSLVKKLRPDIICLGYDQRTRTRSLKHDLSQLGLSPIIIRIPSFHPHLYKSSKLRRAYKKAPLPRL